ncbi:Equistatin [Orchesella cincta]|uniref:Equistatin n=1 Tax=Orchesella cincta TaxID=48709 RepID=A0A1D2NAC8_ORCCI|nr:Equistatin [Orchesella cincta]
MAIISRSFTTLTFVISLAVLLSVTSQNFKCPDLLSKIPDVCNNVKCQYEVNRHRCPKDTIYSSAFSLCGCCPQCVKYISPGDEETPCVTNEADVVWTPDSNCQDDSHCPVKVNLCLPGLECNGTSMCVLPPPEKVFEHETEECMFRKSLYRLDLTHWDPDCESDGSFSPKQCKGAQYDGECFCMNRAGTRIFGREWRIQSENQTCACSRKVYELRAQSLISTLHCSPDGNYEPLQCDTDSGLCYCVDPKTGRMDGSAVPQYHWKTLPCFSVNLTNWEEDGQYLRKCESAFAAGRELQIFGKEHGTTVEMKEYKCDYDGSYAPVQIASTNTECVFKNGSRILDYFKANDKAMTCNCARDSKEYYPLHDRPLNLACQQRTGNYDIAYDFGSRASCVDSDGFLYGDLAPSKYFCCLLKEGCSTVIENSCYTNVTDEGYKPCQYWRYRN